MKRYLILCLTALLCHNAKAQIKQSITKTDLTHINYKMNDPNTIELNLKDIKPLDWSKAKKQSFQWYEGMQLTNELGFKQFNVKGVIADSLTRCPLSGVKCYSVMGKSLMTPRENIEIWFQESCTSNKKGKVSWMSAVMFRFNPDSLISYIFEHPKMESYGITIHLGRFGDMVNIDTIFMTPKQQEIPIKGK